MRINLFGGPGCGKSTTAALLFAELKRRGVQIELVTEYIKTWAWEKRLPTSYDQMYIFAKQLRREDILTRRGIHLITDSPLPLQLIYAKKYDCPFYEELYRLCQKFDKDHPSFNVILKRTVPFISEGRYETLEQAKDLDVSVRTLLCNYGQAFIECDANTQRGWLLQEVMRVLEV